SMPRQLSFLRLSYDINYDFVKELLSRANFTKIQQDRFFNSRFGSVFLPMEVEFEWFVVYAKFNYNDTKLLEPQIEAKTHFSFLAYESSILRAGDDAEVRGVILCLGIIKNHKILAKNQALNFSEFIASWQEYNYEADEKIENSSKIEQSQISQKFSKEAVESQSSQNFIKDTEGFELRKYISYKEVFTPLPTAALAITKTKINDFFVNLRNKPNAKEGKIIATLFSQEAIIPNIYLELDLEDNINPLYKSMITKGQAWYERDDLGSSDEEGYLLYYNYKMQEAYYKKEKNKLTNALFKDEYLILIWDILPNDWCRVWVLRMIAKNTPSSENKETNFSEAKEFDKLEFIFNLKNSLLPFIENYAKDFNASVSSFKLYEGFIHSSGLEYL
ncbi:hypothetical protein, partial [Campylobacter troglodytis]|uniref:hypothetical protein n=2 Tax=Campylobacter troglodytis TaxID=654363 RepID=UPI00163D34AE